MQNRNRAVVVLLAVLMMSSQAFAANTVAELWSSINFTDIIAAVFGIGALVIGVDLAQLGYMKVRRLVKGAH